VSLAATSLRCKLIVQRVPGVPGVPGVIVMAISAPT